MSQRRIGSFRKLSQTQRSRLINEVRSLNGSAIPALVRRFAEKTLGIVIDDKVISHLLLSARRLNQQQTLELKVATQRAGDQATIDTVINLARQRYNITVTRHLARSLLKPVNRPEGPPIHVRRSIRSFVPA